MKRRLILGLAFSLVSLCSHAQMSASASVPIVLRIPGTITLSLRSVPVSVVVTNGTQQAFTVPLSLSWNLNPTEVQAFGVIAYFQDGSTALLEPESSTTIPVTDLLTRWGAGDFVPFGHDATATLFHMRVLPNRTGHKQDSLELKIDDVKAATLPDGSYMGTLYLEIRNY